MLDRYSLDVANPIEVPVILETVSNFYHETASELEGAWQDSSAGAIWTDFADTLDRAAAQCRKALKNRGF